LLTNVYGQQRPGPYMWQKRSHSGSCQLYSPLSPYIQMEICWYLECEHTLNTQFCSLWTLSL